MQTCLLFKKRQIVQVIVLDKRSADLPLFYGCNYHKPEMSDRQPLCSNRKSIVRCGFLFATWAKPV
jgi:hypothetical protein